MLTEIRKIQPAGPYFLSGHSAWGIAGHEIAQQLLSQGEDVDLLAILQSQPPTLHWTRYWLQRLIHRIPWRRPSHWLEFTYSRVTSAWRQAITQEFHGQPLPDWELIGQLQAHYRAKPYSGRITLFLADRAESTSIKWVRKGWARMAAAEFEVIVVPGDHFTMVEAPHVHVLAARIKERLSSSSISSAA